MSPALWPPAGPRLRPGHGLDDLRQRLRGLEASERVARGEALHASQCVRALRALLDQVSDAVIGVDGQGRVMLWNRSAERLLGYRADEMVGRPSDLLVPGQERGGRPGALAALLASGGPVPGGRALRLTVRARDGRELPVEASLAPFAVGEEGCFAALLKDLSAERRAMRSLRYRADHDPLTRLPNRRLFYRRLDRYLAEARAGDGRLAVLSIDLDGFKAVNDRRGHEGGDAVLRKVAARLRAALPRSDLLARLGGDEFAVVSPRVHSEAQAGRRALKLLEAVWSPIPLGRGEGDGDEGEEHVGASVGIALFPRDGATRRALLRAADLSMYQAKACGRARREGDLV